MGAAKRAREELAAASTPEAITERWKKAAGKGIMIGTPIYMGAPTAEYMGSCEDLFASFVLMGIPCAKSRTLSESLVPRARNTIAKAFLGTELEWLMFIDADIVFQPRDVLALLESGHKVVGGAYPRKQMEMEHVIRAVKAGIHEPGRFASSYVVNLLPEDAAEGSVSFDEHGCVPVLDLPTGFLLIHRSAFEEIRAKINIREENVVSDVTGSDLQPHIKDLILAKMPRLEYKDTNNEPVWNFFPCPVVFEHGRWWLLSEDYAFCRMWQEIGGQCWLHTGLELHHVGRHTFLANKDLILDGCAR